MVNTVLGKVHLVGAGPGDPQLLTVKAQRLIERAAVILHDDLVPAAILAVAGLQAEVANVGKRCGAKAITQAQINARMIESARRGLDVVRLHGGDPTVFGRLAEEIDALEEAGIPFEIVSGVTAGMAAAAALGFSLTDRRRSSRVIIVSGHRASKSAPQEKTNWNEVAREDATLVVYMPGNNFSRLRGELLAAGLSADTPAVLMSHIGMPEEQQRFATLADLDRLPPLEAPAVLIIGRTLDRVCRREELADTAHCMDSVGLLL
ncbi:MAG TPA: uroporphyrinogen-III C-methyltransferase [Candidatus Acidoferrales bacterium]|nr:uroporphyrinogen-III C-methyltransferase [Candidatus Acidoferrales bacterium]